MNTNQQLSKF